MSQMPNRASRKRHILPAMRREAGQKRQKKRTHGNGLGSVYSIGTSWMAERTIGWQAVEKEDGSFKKIRISERKAGFPTKREAQQYLNELFQKQQPSGKAVNTIAELYEMYRASFGFERLSKDKQGAYKKAYERIASLKDHKIDLVGIQALRDIISGLNYYPAKYIKDLMSHLYKIAVAEGQVQTNLSQFIELPELYAEETTPWNEDETKALWTAWRTATGSPLLAF